MKNDISPEEELAKRLMEILVPFGDGRWQSLQIDAKVLDRTCSSMSFMRISEENEPQSFGISFRQTFDVSDEIVTLRDNLLTASGHRIWGLKFSIDRLGKFNIEYDYEGPAEYEGSVIQ